MVPVSWMVLVSRTLVFSLLMAVPLSMAVESEEEDPSEWKLWKRANGVDYEEEVSNLKQIMCIIIIIIE